ncbi:hypothetical protein [Streptomyces sp. NPDC053755]|uniref:hypothetical protein n=1 Tax=Streptomyces sp. NPDC053755 TaxID=3155815 RepID=UPI00341ECD16
MPTIHTAEASPQVTVVVEGRSLLAVGGLDELAAAYPSARLRRWPGVLTPPLLNPYGPELLEQTYHPDPREAAQLGTEPLTGAALDRLEMDEARWGASARRGLQRMLAHGTVAVAGALSRPSVVDAARRSGLILAGRAARPDGVPSLDPYATGGPPVHLHPPREGGPARFAVFDVPSEPELARRGAATCVATVLDGRLVFRRR